MNNRFKVKVKRSNICSKFKNDILNVFGNLATNRKVSRIDAIIYLTICFFQIYCGILADDEHYKWNDTIVGQYVFSICHGVRIIPYLKFENLISVYWGLYLISKLHM